MREDKLVGRCRVRIRACGWQVMVRFGVVVVGFKVMVRLRVWLGL